MLQRNAPPFLLIPRIIIEFPIGFLKAYLFRGYCLKGLYGFINSMNYGFSRFLRLAKYWEALKDRRNN
jgi:hypothetical protein